MQRVGPQFSAPFPLFTGSLEMVRGARLIQLNLNGDGTRTFFLTHVEGAAVVAYDAWMEYRRLTPSDRDEA